ncbi:MAG: hypothetical protein JST73_00695 [Actinobacteria bacterium]|nr:hypothetical protein [Actinomycetota bacterium]
MAVAIATIALALSVVALVVKSGSSLDYQPASSKFSTVGSAVSQAGN